MASHPLTRRPAVDEPGPAAGLEDCVRVFEQDFDYVYRTLQRFGASAWDAEDLAQEVFLVVLRRRRDWDPAKPLRPWLSSIAFRVVLAHRRRSAREVPRGLIDAEDAAPQADERVGAASIRRRVLEALDVLPPKQRAVLLLREIDGLSMKEIARSLGLPVFTAYSRLRTARTSFAKEVRRRHLVDESRTRRAVLPLLLAGPTPAAAPPGVRRRVLDRLARLNDVPPGWSTPPPGEAAAAPLAPALLALGLALLVAGTLAGLRPTARSAASVVPPAAGDHRPALAARPARPPVPRPPALQAARAHLAAPAAAPEDAGLARGLVGYWRFDEPEGAPVARDLSGHGGDCQLRRSTFARSVQGPLGGAVRLRAGSWLECPATQGSQSLTTELTLSAWVLRPRAQLNLRTVVSRQHGTGRDDDFYLGFLEDQLLFASRVWHRLSAPIPAGVGRWVHVAAVRDRAGLLRLYADGVEIARRKPARRFLAGTLATSPYANPILVGAANNQSDPAQVDQKLDGAVDELMIFDRALAPEEIALLATGRQPPR